METLTFEFGETPRELIIERWQFLYGEWIASSHASPYPPRLAASTLGAIPRGVGALDDTLTTLDALAAVASDRMADAFPELEGMGDAAADLRRAILAALAIEEG